MQRDSSADASFGSQNPWLPSSPDHETTNVALQLADPGSTLNLCRRLLAFRRDSPALLRGSFLGRQPDNENVLIYRREADSERVTVALNISDEPANARMGRGEIKVSTLDHERADAVGGDVTLAPREGVIVGHR